MQMQIVGVFHNPGRSVSFCKDTKFQKPFYFMHIFFYTFSSFFMCFEDTQMILRYIVRNVAVERPLIWFINKLD